MLGNLLTYAHLNVDFILDGKKYEVETFKINFDQPIDHKGQPQHEVNGGRFMITLTQPADNSLLLWANKSTLTKNGSIIFHTDLGMSVYTIVFQNAYCVTLANNIDSLTGTRTSLIIAPEIITLNGVEHNNFWSR